MKMPVFIQPYFFASCGMNCLVCYVHLKNKKNCLGCLGEDTNKPERCLNCEIKKCVKDKELSHCYECIEFPCIKIKNLDKSYKKRYRIRLIENSKMVKEKGIEEFMNIENKKWQCECFGIISLHDRFCSECKKKIE